MSSHATVHPVFIKMKDIPDSESNWPSVLEVCLTTERETDWAGHSAWCWKCAWPPREREREGERETGQGTVLGAGSVSDCWERERERETGQGTVLGAGSVPDRRERERERETGQDTVLGAGSVPDCWERETGHSAWCWKCAWPQRERRGRAQCLVLEVCLTTERQGRAQCLVLEVCLATERETGQDTVLGAGSVPGHWEIWGKAQCLVLEVCLATERYGARHSAWCWKCASPQRDRAGHSARGPGRQGTMVHLPGHVGGEDPTSGERD